MRYSPLAVLALTAAVSLPSPAGAQTPRVEITGVRVGFPGSIHRAGSGMGPQGRFKPGHWAPVYVDLDVRDAALKAGTYVLQVETTDSDDMQNVYTERRFLPTIEAKEQPTLLTYVRLGNIGSELTVKVLDADPKSERVYRYKHLTQSDINSRSARGYTYGYLTLGGKVRSLYKALATSKGNQGGVVVGNPQAGMGPAAAAGGQDGDEEPDPEEGDNRSFAHVDAVAQMPTYWFGYQAADTVILLTGTQQFVNDLIAGQKDDPFAARRDALAEWVRRGGHLVVSVSANHQEVNQILEQMKIIDLKIEGRTQVQRLQGVEHRVGATVPFVGVAPKNQPGDRPPVEIAKLTLKPGSGVQVLAYDRLVPEGTQPGDALPAIVQAPCGLGRVIVCAFDLDQAPFTAWKGQNRFWEHIKTINEPSDIGEASNQNQWRGGFGMNNDNTELAGKLVHSLESFPDVPVISFGWVALFILVYILIVGPLDYFFLKKVVKRLELTWITFPAVVIVISAVAYFAAYYLKGKDLRINKVDVVDVDLHGNNVYGSTWFTLFSPRIQNYTIGVEPGTGWGAEEKDPRKYEPFVGWLGRPDEGWGGGRGGSQGLFRRAYNYTPDLSKTYGDQAACSGLIGVPIQVWSTKNFSASWARPIKDNELMEAELHVANNDPAKKKLSGTITSKLPVELRDVVLFYRDNCYALDNLAPGSPQRIDDKMGREVNPQTWFGQALGQPNMQKPGRRGAAYGQDVAQPVGSYIKSILFHAYPKDNTQQNVKNSSLRHLDEKWRLDAKNTGEAILFGVAVPPAGQANEGNAEELSQGGLSASKLWLGKLPGTGTRDRIDGTLSQETYVRVYIPVK
jgi:hypothetical protein